MRELLVLMVLALTSISVAGQQQQIVLDKVIAKVGDEYILHSEVAERVAMAEEKKALPEGGKCTILEDLMVKNLLVHYARLDSVEVPEAQVEAELDARIDQLLGMMGNDVRQLEEYYGMSIAQMKELTRQDLRKDLNSRQMRSAILEGIRVTPAEVVDYYEEIPSDSMPFFNSEVEIAELVYTPKVNRYERQKALDQIAEIQERLANGEEFEKLARLYSDDLGSGKQGGSLGRNARGSFVPEFEAAAYRLEAGEISDVVETEFGFHIIRLDGRWGNVIESSHILIRPNITDADLDTAKMILMDVRARVLQDSMTFEEAVKEYGEETVQSYSNGGRVTNQQTGNTFFETSELDHQVFFAIDTIGVGEITGPIEYRTPRGDLIYKLIKLQSRTPPHRASLQQDYSKIQNAAKIGKQSQAISKWIEKKVGDTFIMIDETYDECPNLDKWRTGGISRS